MRRKPAISLLLMIAVLLGTVFVFRLRCAQLEFSETTKRIVSHATGGGIDNAIETHVNKRSVQHQSTSIRGLDLRIIEASYSRSNHILIVTAMVEKPIGIGFLVDDFCTSVRLTIDGRPVRPQVNGKEADAVFIDPQIGAIGRVFRFTTSKPQNGSTFRLEWYSRNSSTAVIETVTSPRFVFSAEN